MTRRWPWLVAVLVAVGIAGVVWVVATSEHSSGWELNRVPRAAEVEFNESDFSGHPRVFAAVQEAAEHGTVDLSRERGLEIRSFLYGKGLQQRTVFAYNGNSFQLAHKVT